MDLRIAHLYPDLMSIYGDRGNVVALTQRARWRDIAVEVRAYTAGMSFDPAWPDLFFFGGGQDQGQDIVGADLQGENGKAVTAAINGGAAALLVCGGYQLFGTEYRRVVAFVLLVGVLMFRPTGLLGESLGRARA